MEKEKLYELIEQLIAPEGSFSDLNKEGYTPRAYAILENSIREAEMFHMDKAGDGAYIAHDPQRCRMCGDQADAYHGD